MKHQLNKQEFFEPLSSKPARQYRAKKRVMGPTTLALATLLPLATLAGCASYSKDNFTVGSVHHTYKTRHPIIIEEREQTLDVPIGSGAHDLSKAALGAIEGFAYRFRKSASGVITIMLPSGSPNEGSAKSARPKVIQAVIISGVPREKIRMTSYYAAEHGSSAPIRLSYIGVKANVEACGKWPDDLAGANGQNHNYQNFGCASQNNMAAMIANPADLLGPRGMSPINAARRIEGLKDYSKGDITLPSSSSTDLNF